MTLYINTENMRYPLSITDVMLSIGVIGDELNFVPPHPFAPVELEELSNLSENQKARLEFPVYEDGRWISKKVVEELTAEDLEKIEKAKAELIEIEIAGGHYEPTITN